MHVKEDTVSSCLIYIEPHGYLLENTEGKKNLKQDVLSGTKLFT